MIPYGRQDISEDDIQSVVDVLRSDYLTQGPVVPAFEKAVARYCGATAAIAVNSATSACICLLRWFGRLVGPPNYLWPPTALYYGAKVDFVDIDPAPTTYRLSPGT